MSLITPYAWLALVPLFWLGVGQSYPFILLGDAGRRIGIVGWAAVTALALYLALNREWQEKLRVIAPRLLPWLWVSAPLLAGAFDILQWRHFDGYGFPGPLLALDLIACAIWLTRPTSRRPEAAIAFYVLHRTLSILLFPLDPVRSDMLAAIVQAGERWLSGGMPYGPSTGGIGRMPYLPLTWVAYLPAAAAKIDPRWIGIVYSSAAGWLVLRQARRRTDELHMTLLALFFLSPYLAFRHELYMDPLFLAIALVAIARGPLLLGVAAGIALATSHWSWVLCPFLLLRAVTPGDWKQLVKAGSAALATAGLVMLPFIAPAPDLFLEAVGHHQGLIYSSYQGGELVFGLSQLAYLAGLEKVLQPLQVALLLGTGTLALREFKRKRRIGPGYGASVLLIFIVLNPFLENYFYLTPVFAAAADRSE
jgi:hypothetical protein